MFQLPHEPFGLLPQPRKKTTMSERQQQKIQVGDLVQYVPDPKDEEKYGSVENFIYGCCEAVCTCERYIQCDNCIRCLDAGVPVLVVGIVPVNPSSNDGSSYLIVLMPNGEEVTFGYDEEYDEEVGGGRFVVVERKTSQIGNSAENH